ncbi:S41 family peptidase [Chitinophaga sp. HK235]|uniref:S41 family peptidase n=1 Tax=Chitinophaga sp. HK235 TaxID=2952571 RepID=UPI001BACF2FC|nr:S41 family peptidase [Chitinophaga sp. HK235]
MQPNQPFRWLITCFLFAAILSSCKKNDRTDAQRVWPNINDSIFAAFKDIYLWSDVIPDSATFKPESYTRPVDMFSALIKIKKNNTSGKALDKYSFLDDGTTSRALQEGMVGNVGFEVGYQTDSTLFVIYVYPGSPADKAGIKRGWQLTSVNGISRFQVGQVTDNLLNNAFSTNSAYTFLKPGNNSQSLTLAPANYSLNPILYANTFNFNGTKVGYIVFNNFVALNDVKPQFDSLFNAFSQAGVTRMIMDLRYNGGGLLETAEYLANNLAPANANNTVMYTQSFNNNVNTNQYSYIFRNMRALPYYPTRYWYDIFRQESTTYKTTSFKKQGSLGLTNLSFLVTYSTVSASELLYNVLKPTMQPHLIGTTTYGKPVGFINIPFGQYDMYAVCFQTFNANGEGNYFDGIAPNITVTDDYTNNWGSFNDPMLRTALTDMGIPVSQLGRAASLTTNRKAVIHQSTDRFQGMIQTNRN